MVIGWLKQLNQRQQWWGHIERHGVEKRKQVLSKIKRSEWREWETSIYLSFAEILLCIPFYPSYGFLWFGFSRLWRGRFSCWDFLGEVNLLPHVCIFSTNKTNFLDPGIKMVQQKSLILQWPSWTLFDISARCFVNGCSDFVTLRHNKRDSFIIVAKDLFHVRDGK